MNLASFYLTWYRVPCAIILMLMALRSTRQLVSRSLELGQIPSGPEAILNIVQDPYIVVVICMFFWAVWIGITLSTRADSIVMLRYGSRTRWAGAQCASAAGEASILVGILLAVALASSTGLPWTGSWTAAAAADVTGVLLPLWTTSGVAPIPAVLLQLLLTVFGLVAIFAAVMLATLLHTRHREVVLVVSCTLAFAVPMLSFKLPSGYAQSLITLIAARPAGWPVTPILLLLLLIGLAFAATRIADVRPAAPPARAVSILAYVVLIGSLMALVAGRSSASNLQELLRDTFYGASTESFGLTQYLVYIMAFLGPGYLALLALGSESLPRMTLLAIRHGRIWPWLRTILAQQALVAALVVAGLLGFDFLLAAGSGLPTSIQDHQMIWHQFTLNGALQIYVTTSITVLVVLLAGSDTAGLAALAILAVIGIPAFTRGFAPSGANMIGLLESDGYTAWQGTVVLVLAALSLTLLCYAATTYRAPQRLITGSIHARP